MMPRLAQRLEAPLVCAVFWGVALVRWELESYIVQYAYLYNQMFFKRTEDCSSTGFVPCEPISVPRDVVQSAAARLRAPPSADPARTILGRDPRMDQLATLSNVPGTYEPPLVCVIT